MSEKITVREACRKRHPLDGSDAQALEHALTITERERDEAMEKYQWMVNHAADQKLDGYRELGARAARAESERDEALAEVERLRETLKIIECESYCDDSAAWARAALERKEDKLCEK